MTVAGEAEVTARTGRHVEPFLRWAGGKRWLAPLLAPYVRGRSLYVEPFLGGGSVFFAGEPARSVLSDLNEDLIETYRALRDDPHDVIGVLTQWSNTSHEYYRLRSATFDTPAERAAQFIYLNKTCWNGLHRVNRGGKFNVPYGNNPERGFFDRDHLLRVSSLLGGADLISGDFEVILQELAEGVADALVYLDPPYVAPADGASSGFRRYNADLFRSADLERMAALAIRLADEGAQVAVSNVASTEIEKLFPGFTPTRFTRRELIAGDSARRGIRSEVLLTSFDFALAGD